MENATNVKNNKVFCHDCKKELKIEDKKIKNGKRLNYTNSSEKIEIFKCNSCFKKNSGLNNFQKCEVYSRIVGYIRPVQQRHKGKQQEFEERKEFKYCCDC